ncbi:hypothetical protein IPM62_03415 [Candidatus Woesebacteria bacterium]|nr:MAG: hypothetical protein IPM62_03415 [Candidatus Woesebacteria bacterium]
MIKNILDVFREYFLILKLKILSIVHKTPPAIWNIGEKQALIIPGFGGNWYCLKQIGDVLNRKGYKIIPVKNLVHGTLSIEESVNRVKNLIDKNDLKNFVIVAHSKGGIIAKELLLLPDYERRINKAICIAVPFGGSVFGKLKVFNLEEIEPGSKLLVRQNAITSVNSKIVNIYPSLDNHVIPNKNLTIKGAINIKLDIVGHTRILFSKSIKKEIEKVT